MSNPIQRAKNLAGCFPINSRTPEGYEEEYKRLLKLAQKLVNTYPLPYEKKSLSKVISKNVSESPKNVNESPPKVVKRDSPILDFITSLLK